jgi:VWFA-related protein
MAFTNLYLNLAELLHRINHTHKIRGTCRLRTPFATVIAMLLLVSPLNSSQPTSSTPASNHPVRLTPNSSPTSSDSDIPAMSVSVKVVNVLATVRDKHGKILRDLSRNDFSLQEDSHQVTIQYFSQDTNLPLTIGLLVDTSMSQRDTIDQEKTASRAFLDQMVRNNDSAFVIHFDREVELLQDLTPSHQKLDSAIESLQVRPPRQEDNDSRTNGSGSDDDNSHRRGRGRGRGMHYGGTTLYDAVYLAADDLMKKQQGRKALIILSDGVDRGSKESLESAIEAAQRADTLVYSIYFKGEEGFGQHRGGFGYPGMGGSMGGPRGRGGSYPPSQRPDGKKILSRTSKETGGRMFEATTKKDALERIYAEIEEELHNGYSLGFTPAKDDAVGYHKLLLTTKQKDDQIHARDGFYWERQ